MHIEGVSALELANELGWNPKYLSVVMNGHRTPKGAEETVTAAYQRVAVKKGLREKGASEDLEELLRHFDLECPEYAGRLRAALGLAEKSAGKHLGPDAPETT